MADITDDKGYNQVWRESKALRIRTQRRCDYIISKMDISKDINILELGSGTGELSAMLAEKTGKRVLGIDMCASFTESAAKNHKLPNLQFKTADFNDPEGVKSIIMDHKFDYVVGNGILHHLYRNMDKSLKNMHSLLVPGGKLIFMEPNIYNPYCFLIFNFRFFRKMAKLDPDEMAFTKSFITKKLDASGFRSVNCEYRDFLIPGVPDFMIDPLIRIGDTVEKVPVLNLMAQSLYITAEK